MIQPKWDRRFWLTLLAVWAIGASTLSYEHRKTTWLVLTLCVAAGSIRARPRTTSASVARRGRAGHGRARGRDRMTLPTFLGIGVPRAGTTWLHTLLSGHPDAYLPTRRKEVRFFDRHLIEGSSGTKASSLLRRERTVTGRSARSLPNTSTARSARRGSRRSCRPRSSW